MKNKYGYFFFVLFIRCNLRRFFHADHRWFGAGELRWGFPEFISLKELKDVSKGFLVADILYIEVQLLGLSAIRIIS